MNNEKNADLQLMQAKVAELVRGHKVLQLGDTSWTPVIEGSAASVHSESEAEGCTAVFVAGQWSAVKREDQESFLKQLRQRVGKDALLILLDDNYVDGQSTPVVRTDIVGNTYQFHSVAGEQRVEVVKNYPADSYLRKKLAAFVREIRIERLKYYWLLNCRLK